MAQYIDTAAVETGDHEMTDESTSEVQESDGDISDEIPLPSATKRRRFNFLEDDGDEAAKNHRSTSRGRKTPTNSSAAASKSTTSNSARTPSTSLANPLPLHVE